MLESCISFLSFALLLCGAFHLMDSFPYPSENETSGCSGYKALVLFSLQLIEKTIQFYDYSSLAENL